jgi:hypothetical protein
MAILLNYIAFTFNVMLQFSIFSEVVEQPLKNKEGETG